MVTVIKQNKKSTTLRVERVDGSTFRAIVDTEDAAKIIAALKKQDGRS